MFIPVQVSVSALLQHTNPQIHNSSNAADIYFLFTYQFWVGEWDNPVVTLHHLALQESKNLQG